MWLFVARPCFLPYTIFFSNTLNRGYCAQPSLISIESSSVPGEHHFQLELPGAEYAKWNAGAKNRGFTPPPAYLKQGASHMSALHIIQVQKFPSNFCSSFDGRSQNTTEAPKHGHNTTALNVFAWVWEPESPPHHRRTQLWTNCQSRKCLCLDGGAHHCAFRAGDASFRDGHNYLHYLRLTRDP